MEMTKKRWFIATALLATCAGLTLAVQALLPPSPGVTKANFDRIEVGMTKSEVEVRFGRVSERLQVTADGLVCEWWTSPAGSTVIAFDERGAVAEKRWLEQEQSFFQRIRAWLRL